MSAFTSPALEKKLAELKSSQESIQTMSLWLIHHRAHYKNIVQVWLAVLKKAQPNRKLAFMHLANDVIQNSKKKGPEFLEEFGAVMNKAFHHVYNSDAATKKGLLRIIQVWEDRRVYHKKQIESFRNSMQDKSSGRQNSSSQRKSAEEVSRNNPEKQSLSSGKRKSSDFDAEPVKKKAKVAVSEDLTKSCSANGPKAEDLIKAMQNMKNCPSMDVDVRQRIADLPPEVADISHMDKIQDFESAEKKLKQIQEARILVSDYNRRLSAELEDRKTLSKMLGNFKRGLMEKLALRKQNIEMYREKQKKLVQIRNALETRLQNLPDLTLLAGATGGLVPLPPARDLFCEDST